MNIIVFIFGPVITASVVCTARRKQSILSIKTSIRIMLCLLVLIHISSCALIDTKTDQLFFVRNAGADMPVWVKGNIESGVFIILVPGWPGLGLFYGENDTLQALGDDYAVVFYDCRGVGASKGNPHTDTMTMDQFIDDLDLIVDTLNHRYGTPEIFLMGHSFGGLLATSYLTDPVRQTKIIGWISLEAASNNPEVMKQLRLALIEFTENHRESQYWSKVLEWAGSTIDFSIKNLESYIRHAKEAGIVTHISDAAFTNDLISSIFLSPAGGIEQLLAMDYMNKHFTFKYEYPYFIPFSELSSITIPAIIIKGNFHLGGMGENLAQLEYDALGTPADRKSIQIFQHSGHHPYISEPKLFRQCVTTFIESNK